MYLSDLDPTVLQRLDSKQGNTLGGSGVQL